MFITLVMLDHIAKEKRTVPDFDPTELLQTTRDPEAFNSHFTPFPETECFGRIKSISARRITTKQGDERVIATFMFTTDDEHVCRETGLTEPQVRYEIWLDTKPNGELLTKDESPNANVRLQRLARVCGIKPGKKYRIADLDGLGCYIKTKQSANPDDDEDRYCNVVAVSAEPFRSR